MLKNCLVFLSVAWAGIAVLFVTPANALVEIDISSGNVQPLPIAITNFMSDDGLGADISGVIKLDGPQPKRPPLQLTPESRKLYEGQPYPRDEVELVSAKGEIKNVFVYIRKGLPAGKGTVTVAAMTAGVPDSPEKYPGRLEIDEENECC